ADRPGSHRRPASALPLSDAPAEHEGTPWREYIMPDRRAPSKSAEKPPAAPNGGSARGSRDSFAPLAACRRRPGGWGAGRGGGEGWGSRGSGSAGMYEMAGPG